MKRTAINRIGAIGRANLESNKRLKEVLAGIDVCEARLESCSVNMFPTNAHRHKRSWYQGDVEALSDYKQVIRICVRCHDQIEFDEELTEKANEK